MLRKILLINVLLISILYTQTYAEFIGPTDVLTTTWGTGNGQVGLQYGDTEDRFPPCFEVSPSGRIAICDIVNNRVVIFKADGVFERNINILTLSMKFDLQENLILSARLHKYDNNGQPLWSKTEGFHDVEVVGDKIIGYNFDTKLYSLYSPTGQLIRTTTERPLELGKVSEKKTATGYTYTVQYPDITNPNIVKTYTVSRQYPCSNYTRDKSGNLYCIGDNGVVRFDEQGNEVASVIIPESRHQEMPRGPGVEPKIKVIEEYGSPIVAPTGDVYTWKRTPTAYSIIKWTWR